MKVTFAWPLHDAAVQTAISISVGCRQPSKPWCRQALLFEEMAAGEMAELLVPASTSQGIITSPSRCVEIYCRPA